MHLTPVELCGIILSVLNRSPYPPGSNPVIAVKCAVEIITEDAKKALRK